MARAKKDGARSSPPGQRIIYTSEMGEIIKEELLKGTPVRRLGEVPGLPSINILYRWFGDADHPLHPIYLGAWKVRSLMMADEVLEIADSTIDKETAAANRLKVDTRKWLMGNFLPKVFRKGAEDEDEKAAATVQVVVVGGDKEHIYGKRKEAGSDDGTSGS